MYETTQTSTIEPVFYTDQNGVLQEDIYYVDLDEQAQENKETA